MVTARIPLILQREIYASAAIAGITLYLVLQAIGMSQQIAFLVGGALVVVLRIAALRWDLHLPTFR